MMCVLLHLLICTLLRAHITVVEVLYKIYYYYYVVVVVVGGGGGGGVVVVVVFFLNLFRYQWATT